MPALQTMLDDVHLRDWIVEKEMCFDDACLCKYVDEYLVCSHRWLTEGTANPRRAPPDPKGVQLAAIREHLAANPKFKYLWLDWPCMWQDDKEDQRDITVDEKSEFDRMLGEVNLLYLGCSVIVLLDLSYLSRFWTMYEAWLSRLQPTARGLELAQGDAATRCHIVPILGASEGFKVALVDQIAAKMATPESAATYLKNDDVSVTNTGDKVKQLAKVSGLHERVRNVLARDAAMVKVHDAARAEPMNAASLRSAVKEAEAVGVGDEKLEDARRALRAVADRPVISQEEMLRTENQLLKDELEEQRGAVLGAMLLAGATAAIARAAGYNLHELKAAGYVEGLKAAGFTCTEVKAAGFWTSEVARAGFRADEAKAAGFFKTIEEAKVAGYVEGLKAGGFSGPKEAGFTCEEAKRGGFSIKELKQAGYTLKEMTQAGYTLKELKQDLEFKVVIDKTSGRSLGAKTVFHGDDTLEIAEVTGDLFQQWNVNHPELAVKRGDCIAEVNGMKRWWTQNKVLELVVNRRRLTEAGALVLKCQKSVEESWNGTLGVYFDVTNKSPSDVLVVGLVAGSFGDRAHATAYACTAGASTGSEDVPGSWEELWSGTLPGAQTSIDVLFQKPVALKPRETRGFFLHSKTGDISFSKPGEGNANNDLSIAPGKFTASETPFTVPQDNDRFTHAGAVKYCFEAEKEAMMGGFSLREAKQEVGYTLTEVKQAGYTLKEAREAGYTLIEVKQAGYTFNEAEQAGYKRRHADEAGYTLDDWSYI